MEYVLKVSPKGQVVLPKELRDSLKIKELVSIETENDTGILKKAELSSEQLAGCVKKYAKKKEISTQKAIKKATDIVAQETARKGH